MRWISQVVSWAGTLYAARLLLPDDYGLVAMAMLGIGLVRMVEDFGLDAILVQDRSIRGNDRAQLGGLLIGMALFLCALFAIASSWIAVFFKEPQVTPVVMVLSLLFITDALQVIPRAQLQRELQFRRLAIATLVQVTATSTALVIAARAGLGHWALVINTLVGAATVTILLTIWQPYAIAVPRDVARLLRPLLQGWRVLASRFAWYGYSNADQTIIGRVLGKDSLGAYSFAATFSTFAQQEIGSIISRVVPGIFSAAQDRRDELRRYFLMLTELLCVISFPMSIGLALTADLVIPLVLGPQWTAVIGPLRLLCLYSAFLAAQTFVSHVLMWTGQFRANMWCAILAGVTMPLALLGAASFGLEGIAAAWVLVFPLVSLPSFFFAFRTIDVGVWDWLNSLAPALVGCAAMAAAVFVARASVSVGDSEWIPVVICIAAGALTYLVTVWFGFRSRVLALVDLFSVLRRGSPQATV